MTGTKSLNCGEAKLSSSQNLTLELVCSRSDWNMIFWKRSYAWPDASEKMWMQSGSLSGLYSSSMLTTSPSDSACSSLTSLNRPSNMLPKKPPPPPASISSYSSIPPTRSTRSCSTVPVQSLIAMALPRIGWSAVPKFETDSPPNSAWRARARVTNEEEGTPQGGRWRAPIRPRSARTSTRPCEGTRSRGWRAAGSSRGSPSRPCRRRAG